MNHKFHATVPNGMALFQMMHFPNESYLIGGCIPGGFIDYIKTVCSTNGEHYSLSTQVSLDPKKSKDWPENFDPILACLKYLLHSHQVDAWGVRSAAILNPRTGQPSIGIYYADNKIFIEFGTAFSGAPLRSIGDSKKFEVDMVDYLKVVKFAINALYDALNMTKNGAALRLQSPLLILAANGMVGSPNKVLGHSKNQQSKDGSGKSAQSAGKGEDKKDLINKIMVTDAVRNFKDVGGQSEAVEEMQALAYGLKNPQIYNDYGIDPVRKILLVGPPGTGKSLLAEALAKEAGVKYYCISAADFISKWVGDAEKNVQAIFDTAEENGPSIIFFDEIDAITQERTGSTHEVTSRVIATINVNLSGMRCKKKVCFIGATNKVNIIDDAIIRAGRFDRVIKVGMPNQKGREDIFKIHLRLAQEKASKQVYDLEEVDFILLAQKMDGKTGADIREIVRRTIDMEIRRITKGGEFSPITTDLLVRQIDSYEERKEEEKRKVVQGFGGSDGEVKSDKS